MKLSGRLGAIAELIPKCGILSDIGTDHAYIPIFAVENKLCERALAADLRKGPLEMAEANIRKHGLESRIELRLGNGLEPIRPEECDVIVMAGMGGLLIRDILSSEPDKTNHASLLLLQANNAVDALRKWLYENGYDILEEKLISDAGKLYSLIKSKWTGVPVAKDEFDIYIGEKIFEGNEALLGEYLQKKLKELEVIIEGRSRSDPEKDRYVNEDRVMDTATCKRIRDRLVDYLGKSDLQV
jgi:tRNA (adenine22-N1)-methyltransferase